MGRLRRSRTHSNPKKNQAPGQKTRRYKRDIDQIHEDLKDGGIEKMESELRKKDLEDLPGMAQHGCLSCSRYFANAVALTTHQKGKPHKRRQKILLEEPYTIEESRAAAGYSLDKTRAKGVETVVEETQVEMEVVVTEEVMEVEKIEVPVIAAASTGLVGRMLGLVGIKA